MTPSRCLPSLLAAAVLAAGCSRPDEKPPAANLRAGSAAGIVLVAIDTLRADHLGAYGYSRPTSPHLDRLAAEGAVFENAITQATFSGPAYATILTGKLPQEHGVRDHPQELPEDNETVAEAARRQGCRTGGFVTHPFLARQWKFDQGFEQFEALVPAGGEPGERVAAGEAVRKAVDWLATVPAQSPFFLFVQLSDPHFPYRPPAPFDRRFGAAPAGYDLVARAAAAPGGHGFAMFSFRESGFDDADLGHTIALYDGAIAHADDALAALWEALRAAGRLDSTVVAVTADHGEMLGEHDLYFHHDSALYEPVVRVPLIVRFPARIPAGRRVGTQVRLMDLASTLLDLAGLTPPAGATGRSLQAVFKSQGRDLPAFAENQSRQEGRDGLPHYRVEKPGVEGKWRMARMEGAKLILVPDAKGLREELYDLAADPGETTNRIGQRPDLEARLRALLGEHLRADPGLAAGKAAEGGEVDEQTLDELKALGYVG